MKRKGLRTQILRHISFARDWLERAEKDFHQDNPTQGELHLSLVEAEIRHAWEESAGIRPCTPKPGLNRGLWQGALLLAMCGLIFLVSLVTFPQKLRFGLRVPEFAPAVVGQPEVLMEPGAEPQPAAKVVAEEPKGPLIVKVPVAKKNRAPSGNPRIVTPKAATQAQAPAPEGNDPTASTAEGLTNHEHPQKLGVQSKVVADELGAGESEARKETTTASLPEYDVAALVNLAEQVLYITKIN